jgi:hypothetical protein
MNEQQNALSRNPNICASCSSMVDAMEKDEPNLVEDALMAAQILEAKKTTEPQPANKPLELTNRA